MGASEFISSPNSGNALNEVQYWYMDANDNTPFDLISADKLLRCHSHRFPWPEVEIYAERVRIVAIYWPYPVKYFLFSGWYFIDGSVIYEIDSVFILKSNVINHLQPQQHQPSARRYGGCWRRKEVISENDKTSHRSMDGGLIGAASSSSRLEFDRSQLGASW